MNRLIRDFRERKVLKNHDAVVVGAGRSGVAAAKLLVVLGANVTVVDANKNLPQRNIDAVAALGPSARLEAGPHTEAQFRHADIVVLSPGVPVKRLESVLTAVPERKVVAELELASWFIERPVIAITGTNGKTTTTTLVGHILSASGRRPFVGGNIGTPLCEHLLGDTPADVLVLEVSSFQLQNCRMFKPDVGVLLNFSANHLDYHADMEEYLHAKLNLFARQTPEDVAVLPAAMREALETRDFTRARKVWYAPMDRFVCPGLPGEHNRANIEAAWQAVSALGVTVDEAAEAVREFVGLEHRIQALGEKDGILFVNDSKSTNLDATTAAVQSFGRPVRLLLGGVFKGGDVSSLLPALRGRAVQIGLFGAAREVFEQGLGDEFPIFWEPSLEGAVKRLYADAVPGDMILLSPATASFDAYSGYAERGRDFQRIFAELPEGMHEGAGA